jgi:hypothetical protein
LSQGTVQSLAKFYTGFLENGAQHLPHEVIDFHSARVNPRELAVATIFFATLATEVGFKAAPNVRHYLLLSNYNKEKLRASASGASAISNFLEVNTIVSFSKKTDQVEALEQALVERRSKCLPILERQLAPAQARLEFFSSTPSSS